MKTVLITGATSGIGLSCVELFARNGWRVVCLGRNLVGLDVALSVARAAGGEALAFPVDFASDNAAHELFRVHGTEIGLIDALINSAGVADAAKIEDVSDAEWERTFRVNVTAAFAMVREALPALEKSDAASVVNVSSIAGRLRSISLSAAYSTSKAALLGLTRHLAGELGPRGIRVNCVCPSQTLTPMLNEALSPEGQEKLAASIPLRRLARPEEQAAAIYFLCTPASSYVNGAILDVNGGIL